MKIVVVGGGIAGLAAARRLEALLPGAELALIEQEAVVGGKLSTERVDGFVVERAADSFLSRKERGIGLADELGLAGELIGRRPESAGTFVRHGDALHRLPEGLTGMIPTSFDTLASGGLLSDEGRSRVEAEPEQPVRADGEDESVASFMTRRLGREAYERLVEPLMTGIYGGDGEQLSLAATFPQLRALELEQGSVVRGLLAATPSEPVRPPFLSFPRGMATLAERVSDALARTRIVTSTRALALQRAGAGYEVQLEGDETLRADGVVVAVPAHAAVRLLAGVSAQLAAAHAEIPHASSAIVTLAYRVEDLDRALDGYGYVVPRSEGTEVLACTWSSSKWEGRTPPGFALVRVYAGRFGRRDVTVDADEELLALASDELHTVGIEADPVRTWIHRWPGGMPQYVLGHLDRVTRIEAELEVHPGLAVAGAAYRGVGIPDCIASGERAAGAVAATLGGDRDSTKGAQRRVRAETS